jgi:hypothetical protein
MPVSGQFENGYFLPDDPNGVANVFTFPEELAMLYLPALT